MGLAINSLIIYGDNADGSAYSFNTISSGFSMIKGRVYLLIVGLTGSSSHGTITGTTFTWTQIAAVGDSTRRLAIYRCLAPTTKLAGVDSEEIFISSFGGSNGSYKGIWEIVGGVTTGTNGADVIVQSVTGSSTGTDPSLSLPSSIVATSNRVVSVWMNDRNPFGGAPESGFTEISDTGYDPPVTGGYAMNSSGATQDNTPTITATSSTWIGIALEIRAWVAGLYPYFFPQGV